MTASRDRIAYAELRSLSGRMAADTASIADGAPGHSAAPSADQRQGPVGNSRMQWRQREGLLLLLGDAEGRIGLGEASPLPGYSPDELGECAARLRQLPWSELARELGERPRAAATAPGLAGLPAAARCAAETALLDLMAQRRGVPLATLLRGPTPAAGVAVSALLRGESPAALLASARAARARGLSVLKLKLGRPGGAAWELAAARLLRQELGPDVTLRLDANRAWSLAEATERLAALAELAPELVEEPLADVRELPRLRTTLPIALDESLQHLDPMTEVAPLLAAGTVRALVLKPMALGGLLRCLQLAELAAAHRAPALVTHLFDGTVALAAAAAVALALPLPLACGLDAHPGLALGPQVALDFLGAPQIPPPTAPGLGITLAPTAAAALRLGSTRGADAP